MKLIAQVKLKPTAEQYRTLLATLETANTACTYISEWAWQNRVFRQYDIHQRIYYDVRQRFGLAAQVTVRAIAKVADAYKANCKTQRIFKPTGGIAYDERILRWFTDRQAVSIWTTAGRLDIPYACGEQQRELLKHQRGESDLILFQGDFYLLATCQLDDPDTIDIVGVLGVDLGIINIAADSDGETFSGCVVNAVRHRYRRLRAKLQRKQTRAARRRQKKMAGKERRFGRHVNHVISKRIVAKAQGTQRAIAVEKLDGIRQRTTVRRSQRATLHSWSFYQLKGFILYKARQAGVPVIEVDPRNTSRTCPVCGCVDKRNRPTQSLFSCVSCGHSGAADTIAAGNIASRALVSAPYFSA